jgi:hypothetical protein
MPQLTERLRESEKRSVTVHDEFSFWKPGNPPEFNNSGSGTPLTVESFTAAVEKYMEEPMPKFLEGQMVRVKDTYPNPGYAGLVGRVIEQSRMHHGHVVTSVDLESKDGKSISPSSYRDDDLELILPRAFDIGDMVMVKDTSKFIPTKVGVVMNTEYLDGETPVWMFEVFIDEDGFGNGERYRFADHELTHTNQGWETGPLETGNHVEVIHTFEGLDGFGIIAGPDKKTPDSYYVNFFSEASVETGYGGDTAYRGQRVVPRMSMRKLAAPFRNLEGDMNINHALLRALELE